MSSILEPVELGVAFHHAVARQQQTGAKPSSRLDLDFVKRRREFFFTRRMCDCAT
jgi:hypothetical protein